MIVLCKKCGKLFGTLNAQAKYCRKCAGTVRYYTVNKIVTIHCKTCGKKIRTNKTKQLFCDDKCRKNYHYVKQFHTEICAFCGKAFEASTRKKKYCNNECYLGAKKVRDDFRNHGGKLEVS